MARIRCFFLEHTGRVQVYLRRYQSSLNHTECPDHGYHDAQTSLGEEPEERSERGYISNGTKSMLPHDDPRWPIACSCGYTFQEHDHWQRNVDSLYQRTDTQEETTIRNAPVGAMWDAWWMNDFCQPQGKHNLAVKTPGGDWMIDSQASNCTMKDDRMQEHHHCWVRTGEPPDVTAGKDGVTCGAGAGSIQCGSYHGFLRGGWLED